MQHFLRILRFWLIVATPVAPFADAAAVDIERQTVSGKEMDQMIASEKHHDFIVTANDILIDSSGQKIKLRDLKKALKKGKYDKSVLYVLWLESDAVPKSKAEPIVPILAAYGIDKVMLRVKRDPTTTSRSEKPADGQGPLTEPGKKTLLINVTENHKSVTASDPFPDMKDRPPELRPGKLPRRVRYQFKTDAEVMAAAKLATNHLLTAEPPSGTLFNTIVMVSPGAWPHFRNDPNIGHKDGAPITANTNISGKAINSEGMLLRNAAEIGALETNLRDLIRRRGGGTLRAMKTGEMDRWWTFIALDIEEPVFVLETKDHAFAFVLGFKGQGLFILDELNGLPDY